MSKLQHTQGLWTVDHGLIVTNGMDYPDALDICAVFVGDIDDPFEIEKAKADARLIAATPEMLEALISVYQIYIDRDICCDNEFIKSVIEKATGLTIEEVLS